MSGYFVFESRGRAAYEIDSKGGHWAFLLCDPDILEYYRWHLLKWGCKTVKCSGWGSNVTWVRNESPTILEPWGRDYGDIPFQYSNIIRGDNGRHAWIDVWCPYLHELRASLGLPPKAKESFHLTLGELYI